MKQKKEPMNYQEAAWIFDGAVKRTAKEQGLNYPDAVQKLVATERGAALYQAWNHVRTRDQREK